MQAERQRSMLPKPNAFLFDWDGTLVDSHPILAAAMNHTLAHYGRAPWSYEEWLAWLGLSARDAFPREFGEHWEEARQIYLDAYESLHLDRIQALAGATEVLTLLRGADIPIGIVSNKTGHYLRSEVVHLGWQDYFRACIGSGDSAHDKPAVDPAYDALEKMEVMTGSNVWFIGDNDVDVACGRKAGCTTVLVGDAYPRSSPDHRVIDLDALRQLIQRNLELVS